MKKYGKAGNKEKYEWYKKLQLVQKILLNSLYGVLGLFPLGSMMLIITAVTIDGQTLLNQLDMANIKYNKELGDNTLDSNIYIDTDSVFFRTLLDRRIQIGKIMSRYLLVS